MNPQGKSLYQIYKLFRGENLDNLKIRINLEGFFRVEDNQLRFTYVTLLNKKVLSTLLPYF